MLIAPAIRSRGACLTCKSRKKKCDEQKPVCARCIRGGLHCLGYSPKGRPISPNLNHIPPQTIQGGSIVSGPWEDRGSSTSNGAATEGTSDSSKQHFLLVLASQQRNKGQLFTAIRTSNIFGTNVWDNLLDRYSSLLEKMISHVPNMLSFVSWIVQDRALQGPVVRNAMLSIASLHMSFENRKHSALWKRQAMHFNTLAQTLLRHEMQRRDVSLMQKLMGLVEVLMFDLTTKICQTSSSHELLQQGKSLIMDLLGSRNAINISWVSKESLQIVIFAWIDVISSIYTARSLQIQLESKPKDPSSSDTEKNVVSLENVVCCPDIIVVALSRISNLREQARDERAREGAVSSFTLNTAALIESDIRSWKSSAIDGLAHQTSTFLCAQECWRFAALIYLYQTIHHIGPLHPIIVNAVQNIKDLSRLVPCGSPQELRLSLPYFLAGTAAVHTKDRAYFKERIAAHYHLGETEWVPLLDKVWKRSDQMGCPVDWNDVVREWHVPCDTR